MLRQLGVGDEDIIEVGGINTAEELRHLADERLDGQRVGLITSAWHMQRALRQARAQGLELEPVPADFLTPVQQTQSPGPAQILLLLLPNSGTLNTTGAALKEYLAILVRR